MRRTTIPNGSNRADQLTVLANHFRRHTADMSLHIKTDLLEQTGASNPLPTEDPTDLWLTRSDRLGYRCLRYMPLPTDFCRAENPSLLIWRDHVFCIVLRIYAW